jgi:hypothetical protein
MKATSEYDHLVNGPSSPPGEDGSKSPEALAWIEHDRGHDRASLKQIGAMLLTRPVA